MAAFSDGVIVGSAIVRIVAEHRANADRCAEKKFVKEKTKK